MGHVFFGLLLGLLRKAEILLSHRITKGVFTALAVFLDLGFAGVTFAGSFEWRRLKDSSGFGLPLSDIDSRRFRIQLFARFMFATGCALSILDARRFFFVRLVDQESLDGIEVGRVFLGKMPIVGRRRRSSR